MTVKGMKAQQYQSSPPYYSRLPPPRLLTPKMLSAKHKQISVLKPYISLETLSNLEQ